MLAYRSKSMPEIFHGAEQATWRSPMMVLC
jgi:hypothetical protein